MKNLKLFGNRFLSLQTFEKAAKRTDVSDDFAQSLNVDRYGFVFIDNVPKRGLEFAIGDVIQCKQDSMWIRGVVSRVFVDRICVKLGDNDLFSFQWIERIAFSAVTYSDISESTRYRKIYICTQCGRRK